MSAPPDGDSGPGSRSIREWSCGERRLLAATIALAILLRIACWQGIGYLDSLSYAVQSLRVLDEGPAAGLGSHQQNRLGMTLPPAALAAALGRSETTLVLWFLVLSAAEAWFVPRLLARILPAPGAIAASALYLLAPQTVRGATTNAADNAMAVWANLGMLTLLAAPPAGRLRAAALGGLLLGVANLHKETAAVLLPVAAAAVAVGAPPGRRLHELAAFAAGFGAVLAAETAAFAQCTGEPFLRWTGIGRTHGELGQPDWDATTRAAVMLRQWPGNLLGTPSSAGVLLYVLPAALVAVAARRLRGRGLAVVAAWLLLPGLWTVLGTSTPTAWRPLLPYPRYLQFVFLPAAILAARFLTEPGSRPPGRTATAALSVVPVAMAVLAVAGSKRGAESTLAACAGLALLALTRTTAPRIAVVVAVTAAGSLGPVVSRLTGTDVRGGAAEREAVAWARAAGKDALHAAPPALQRLDLLVRLEPGLGVRILRHDETAAARGEVVIVLARDPAPPGTEGSGGTPQVEVARFPAEGTPVLRALAPAR